MCSTIVGHSSLNSQHDLFIFGGEEVETYAIIYSKKESLVCK